jgi:putative Holliday junction resolvase
MKPGRVVSLDVGTKTIGVAACDPSGRFVLPDRTVSRRGVSKDSAEIGRICREKQATRVVVGLPLTPEGDEGRSARLARQIGEAVAAATGLPVDYQDERYSTVEADWRLQEAGLDGRQRREVVDATAAVVILEDWLARQPG